MGNPITGIRGLNKDLFKLFTKKVIQLHGGKSKGIDGSYVARELELLMKLYLMSGGGIVHSELGWADKKGVVKDTLVQLHNKQVQSEVDGFNYAAIKETVEYQCLLHDRYDPRTHKNYINAVKNICIQEQKYVKTSYGNEFDITVFRVPDHITADLTFR